MTTFLLEAYNTDSRYADDIRHRSYTTSRRKAEAFGRLPKIQFTDSGHGIVFHAKELPPRTRRLPERSGLSDYIAENLYAPESAAPIVQLCACGHTTRWHSHHGTGDCEFNSECGCLAFAADESDLLVELAMLLHWGVVHIEQNTGATWFAASDLGTHLITAGKVRQLYAEEMAARGY